MIRAIAIARLVLVEMIRRRDVYALLIVLAAMLAALLSLNVFGLGGTAGYVKEIGLLAAGLLGWSFAIQTGARQLPREEQSGTLFPLLAKPVSRWELVLGKWLGAWLAACAALAAFALVVLAAVAFKGGSLDGGTLLQAYVLQITALAAVTALAVCLSTRMHADASATLAYLITGAAFLLTPRIPHLLTVASPGAREALMALYYLLPHAEWFDLRRRLVHGWGPAPWSAFGLVVAYGALWTAAALLAAWAALRRKRFDRGAV